MTHVTHAVWQCHNGTPTFKPPLNLCDGKYTGHEPEGFDAERYAILVNRITGYTLHSNFPARAVEDTAERLRLWAVDDAVLVSNGCTRQEYDDLIRMFEGFASRGALIKVVKR